MATFPYKIPTVGGNGSQAAASSQTEAALVRGPEKEPPDSMRQQSNTLPSGQTSQTSQVAPTMQGGQWSASPSETPEMSTNAPMLGGHGGHGYYGHYPPVYQPPHINVTVHIPPHLMQQAAQAQQEKQGEVIMSKPTLGFGRDMLFDDVVDEPPQHRVFPTEMTRLSRGGSAYTRCNGDLGEGLLELPSNCPPASSRLEDMAADPAKYLKRPIVTQYIDNLGNFTQQTFLEYFIHCLAYNRAYSTMAEKNNGVYPLDIFPAVSYHLLQGPPGETLKDRYTRLNTLSLRMLTYPMLNVNY